MMASCLHGVGIKGELLDTQLRPRLKTFPAKSKHFPMLTLFRRLLVVGTVWLLMITEKLMLGVEMNMVSVVKNLSARMTMVDL
uniref:Uncharacterized protein n=1 Tax=Medicago truncatula TaxID=3880 RepID=I3T105_MEDTR|nr:unknown [Medicago truncatula]AFK46197.1 unknown [Medicago truncatula]